VTVESDEVVSGDIVLFSAGDRLPADVRFLEVNGLEINESVMTGESIAVRKTCKISATPPAEMSEADNIGFAGTVVTAGRGEGIVIAIGKETALGDISKLVGSLAPETSFERGIREFSRFILKLVFFTIALIFIANVIIKGGNINVAELLIFSLALAVSVVPEALPAVLTVALSRGSMRLAQKKVVVKRLSAIEDLGSIEILCTDKTGTITENALSVSKVRAADEQLCLKLAFAACLEEPMNRGRLHDAFDLALWQALSDSEREEMQKMKRLNNVPFDPERRRNSVLVESLVGQEIIVRGAPEEVLQCSHNADQYTRKASMEFLAEAGRRGERVIAVARRAFSADRTYTAYEEQNLEFLGLISFVDQLKKTAKQTIEKAANLNVAVKILTGDSKEVAGSVGYAIGLIANPDSVITGKELDEMDHDERRKAVFSESVFARVSPEQKYAIIKTLQEEHIVGFLGEGINDAPALRLANVGIVVESASDIAREASDVVLLQKSLEAVIDGIKEGRIIFANILKYLRITLTSNFGNFYSVAVASIFLPFVPLLPAQILLIDLLSDFPMLAMATDTVDSEELENPRKYNVRDIVLVGTFLGAVSSIFDFIIFGTYAHVSPEALQTAWFFLSAFTEVVLIFSLRSKHSFFKTRKPSVLLGTLAIFVLGIVSVLPFIPAAREVFSFINPPRMMLPFIVTITVVYFASTEAMKYFYYRHVQAETVSFKRGKAGLTALH
jgi:Mg2+-importing ATPase